MAHDLEVVNGKASIFSVNKTPWHNLGTVIKDAPNIDEVLKLAGLDWTVSMQSLYLGAHLNSMHVTQRAIVRDSDKKVLGFAGNRYNPLQNKDALEFFRPFHDSGEATFETAGSLRGGQKVWILAALQRKEIDLGSGDTVKKFLLLSNGHDGTTGIKVGFTPIRVVCANTLAMAHNKSTSKLLRVFHSKKVKENLKLIQETVNAADAEFEATAEQYRRLTKIQINQNDLKNYVTQVFYNGAQAESDREKIARESLDRDIQRLFETGQGNDLATATNETALEQALVMAG